MQLTGNIIDTYGDTGIYLYDSCGEGADPATQPGNTISGNTITNGGIYGIRIHTGCNGNTVDGNTIVDNNGEGIAIWTYSNSNIIFNNDIYSTDTTTPFQNNGMRIVTSNENQIIQNRDKERQELMTENAGIDEMDKEIQINVDVAALKVKAAKMELASLLFDQKYEITIHKHKNRVVELEHEIARKNHNIEVFQKQLDDGRPVQKKPKKPIKPISETSGGS